MGLLKSGINEVIATTSGNAAPMGIHFHDGVARMILFLGSHTAENIERDGWVIANFTHDPVLYVRTAFEDIAREDFIDEAVGKKTMQRLSSADAWAAFTTSVERKTRETLIVRLSLEKEIIEKVEVHPVNRGFGNIIDATVHATRYCMTHDPEIEKLILYHAGIIRKCGGKKELLALEKLLSYCRHD